MQEFPASPPAEAAPSPLFEEGHIWLHELVDGAPFRFQARSDGRLRFGDDVRTFGDDVPPEYDHVVRYVRETFDRGALRDAVDDVESVVFFGYAMHRRGVDYDWTRTPSFLGSDVWSGESSQYLLPDAVGKIYERLGLAALPQVQAEVRAADFDPGSYELPPSAWYDGPVAGVLVRNKTGLRARIENPAVDDGADAGTGTDEADPIADAEAFARRQATTERFSRVADRLRSEGRPVTFDTLYQRTVEVISRAQHHRLFGDGVDVRAFRSAVAERTGAYLGERD